MDCKNLVKSTDLISRLKCESELKSTPVMPDTDNTVTKQQQIVQLFSIAQMS